MGTAFSSIKSVGAKPRDDLMDLYDNEDDDPRPTKRRKFNNSESRSTIAQNREDSGARQPLGQVMSNQRARSSKVELVQPSDFYGKAKRASFAPSLPKKPSLVSETGKVCIDDLIPKSLDFFSKSLRVDVFEINPSVDIEGEILNFATVDQPSINISCRVMASIYYHQQEEKQEDKTYTEICRLVNPCTLRVSIAKNGEVSRKFVDLDPFYFLPEHFYIKRKCRKPNGQWGGYESTTGFADKYLLSVMVESTEYHEDWPSLDIPENAGVVSQGLENGEFSLDDLHLIGKITPFSDPERQRKIALQLCHVNCYKQKKQSIPYTLNLQVRWAVPNTMANVVFDTPKHESKNESPRAAMPAPSATAPPPIESTSPAPRRVEDASVENSPANSRAQRQRKDVQTYNLKTLSTLAQGKSPRKRKPREPRPEQDELTVTYSFGKADAAETGVKQQTTISGLNCPFCNTRNASLEELRLHLHTDHGALKFHLRRNSPRVQFFIELAKSRSAPMLDIDRSKVFQLGKPRGLFDLDKYLAGNESWVKARHGPQHGLWPDHLRERGHDSSLSSSPHGSRYSSPNTSNGTDDAMDFETFETKLPVRPRQAILVPRTTKPLYDAVTKRVLQPGEEIPTSDDEREEGWLHQKQRDLVNDFTDVTAEEKDYINEWNPFIVEQHLTSDKYLSEAIVRFAESKKIWFTERISRKREFMKHMETFILRGVLEEKYLHRSMDILRVAEQVKQQLDQEDTVVKDVEMEMPVRKSRGLLMCVCDKLTQPPNRVICTGSKCPARFFCRDCAKSYGQPINSAWKCNECVNVSG